MVAVMEVTEIRFAQQQGGGAVLRTRLTLIIRGKRGAVVTEKEKVLQAVRDMPDDASIEDAMERLLFLAKIEKGILQADAGQTIPHDHVKARMGKWLR